MSDKDIRFPDKKKRMERNDLTPGPMGIEINGGVNEDGHPNVIIQFGSTPVNVSVQDAIAIGSTLIQMATTVSQDALMYQYSMSLPAPEGMTEQHRKLQAMQLVRGFQTYRQLRLDMTQELNDAVAQPPAYPGSEC